MAVGRWRWRILECFFFAVKDFFGKQQRNYFHESKVPGENTLGFVDVACNDRHTLVLFS